MPEMTETQTSGLERHRKEKINAGINRIGNLLPCSQALKQSKNMILDQAVRYITDLKKQNDANALEGGDKVQAPKGSSSYSNGNVICPAGKEPGLEKHQTPEAILVQPAPDANAGVRVNGVLHHVNAATAASSAPSLLPGATVAPLETNAALRVVEGTPAPLPPAVSYITLQIPAVNTSLPQQPQSAVPSQNITIAATPVSQLSAQPVVSLATVAQAGTYSSTADTAVRTVGYTSVPSSTALLKGRGCRQHTDYVDHAPLNREHGAARLPECAHVGGQRLWFPIFRPQPSPSPSQHWFLSPKPPYFPLLQTMQVLQVNPSGTTVSGVTTPQNTNNPSVVILQQANACSSQSTPMNTSDKAGTQGSKSTLQLVQPTTAEEPTTNVALNSLGALSSLNKSISQGLPLTITSQTNLQMPTAPPLVVQQQQAQQKPTSAVAPAVQEVPLHPPSRPLQALSTNPLPPAPAADATKATRKKASKAAIAKRGADKRTKPPKRRDLQQAAVAVAAKPVVSAGESPAAHLQHPSEHIYSRRQHSTKATASAPRLVPSAHLRFTSEQADIVALGHAGAGDPRRRVLAALQITGTPAISTTMAWEPPKIPQVFGQPRRARLHPQGSVPSPVGSSGHLSQSSKQFPATLLGLGPAQRLHPSEERPHAESGQCGVSGHVKHISKRQAQEEALLTAKRPKLCPQSAPAGLDAWRARQNPTSPWCPILHQGQPQHTSSRLANTSDHNTMQRLMSSRSLEQQLIPQPSNAASRPPPDMACAPSRQERHRVSSYSAEALIGKSSSNADQQQQQQQQSSSNNSSSSSSNNNNNAWACITRRVAVLHRSSLTCTVTWTRPGGRPALDTPARTAFLTNTQAPPMCSAFPNALRSSPWSVEE
ncbi:hypothetical protein CRUP_000513 [Coryphaenoides rupestris]|nr:hypothetical protein CRUP_000513 [Coryphaenoides rupestris]